MKQIIIFLLIIAILKNIFKKEHFESSLAVINLNSVFGSDNIFSYNAEATDIKTDDMLINNLTGDNGDTINIDSNINSNTINSSEIIIDELCNEEGDCIVMEDIRKYKEFSLLDSDGNKQSLDLSKVPKFKNTVSNMKEIPIGTMKYKSNKGDAMELDIYQGSGIVKKGGSGGQLIHYNLSFTYNKNYPDYDRYKICGYSITWNYDDGGVGLRFVIEYDSSTKDSKITYYNSSLDITNEKITGSLNKGIGIDMNVMLVRAEII